jgi:hypothetical protein
MKYNLNKMQGNRLAYISIVEHKKILTGPRPHTARMKSEK